MDIWDGERLWFGVQAGLISTVACGGVRVCGELRSNRKFSTRKLLLPGSLPIVVGSPIAPVHAEVIHT